MWITSFRASTQKSFDPVLEPVANTVSFQGIRDAPGQNLPGEPVHDSHHIEKAAAHRDLGDVGALRLGWAAPPAVHSADRGRS